MCIRDSTYTAPKPSKANFTVTKEYNDSEGEARAIEANQFRFMLTGQDVYKRQAYK